MRKPISKLLAATALFVVTSTCAVANQLEDLFKGVRNCDLDDVVYVPESTKPTHMKVETPLYVKTLKQVTTAEGIVRFATSETFYGLQTKYIDIPVVAQRDDNQVWRIYFSETFEDVRKKLQEKLRLKFDKSSVRPQSYINGERPTILVEPNTGYPALACRKTEQGE